MTPATAGSLQGNGSHPSDTFRTAALFPPSSSLHARGLVGLLVRSGLAVAAWGERRAVRTADAAVLRPGRRQQHRPVRGWADPTAESDRYASRKAAGYLAP